MRAGDIVFLSRDGALMQGVRDADTEDSRGFSVLVDSWVDIDFRVRFEDEGVRWARGTIDSPAARALLTVASLREERLGTLCSECGEQVTYVSPTEAKCRSCGATFP